MKVSLVLVVIACVACISFAEEHQVHHSQTAEEGSNHDNKGGKAIEQKHEVSSGKSSKHDQESSKKGQDFKDVHKTNHLEKKGKKTSHHLEDSHKSSKHAAGGSHHGLKYADGKKYKKGNYLKGFREKFHKDEEKKHDSFFSKGEKSGQYEVYGKKKSKFATDSFNKKNKKNHKNSVSGKTAGKAYKSANGHHDSDHKAHQAQGGSESHHKSSEKHGKKHASHGGKKYKNLDFLSNKYDQELPFNFIRQKKINISKQNDNSTNKLQIGEEEDKVPFNHIKNSDNSYILETGYQDYGQKQRRKRETEVLNNIDNSSKSFTEPDTFTHQQNNEIQPTDGIIRITIIKEDGVIFDRNITLSNKIHKSYKKHHYKHHKKQVGQTQSELPENGTENDEASFKIIRLKPLRSRYGRKNRTNILKRRESEHKHHIKLNGNHYNYQNIGNNESELQNITNTINNTSLHKGEESEYLKNNTAETDVIFYRLLGDHQEDHDLIDSNNTALEQQNKSDENYKEHIVQNYNTAIVQGDNRKAQERHGESKCSQICNCKNITTEMNKDNSDLQQNNTISFNTQNTSKVQLRQDETSLIETKIPRPRKKHRKKPLQMDYWLVPMVFF